MVEAERESTAWMWTYSGKKYWPTDPRAEDVCIEDIAHALSLLCRYAGHVSRFYSVAEHSVLVSQMVPPALALEGLLHDASEAYCGDLIRPVKRAVRDYRIVEDRNAIVIRTRFRLPDTEHPSVKQADNDILHTEYRALMLSPLPADAYAQVPGVWDPSVKLEGWPPSQAEGRFLQRFRDIMGGRG